MPDGRWSGGVKLLRPAESFLGLRRIPRTRNCTPYFPSGSTAWAGRTWTWRAPLTPQRGNRHNHGWCQDSIQAACLGLGDEAGRLVAARAAQINRGYRFPVMWGPNFDWIPDQDHGNNILTTLQFMLLQSDGDKLYVLPAWPKTWNVSFKLHAAEEHGRRGRLSRRQAGASGSDARVPPPRCSGHGWDVKRRQGEA